MHAWQLLLLITSLPAETSGIRPGRSAAWLGPTVATAMHCKSFNSFGGQSHGTINICEGIIAQLTIGNFNYYTICNLAVIMGGGGGKTAHAWLQMHVQQPFLAPWGNSKLLAVRCGVKGTTHVEKSEPTQLFFTWHDSTRLKNAVHLPKMPAPGPTLAGWGGWGLLVARWWVAHGPPQAKLGPRATPWPQLGFGPCTGKNAVQLPKNPATRAVLAGPSS